MFCLGRKCFTWLNTQKNRTMYSPVSEAIITFFPRHILGMANICMTVGRMTFDLSRAATTSERSDSCEKLSTAWRGLEDWVRAGCWRGGRGDSMNTTHWFSLYLGLWWLYDNLIYTAKRRALYSCSRRCPWPHLRLDNGAHFLHLLHCFFCARGAGAAIPCSQ